MSSMADLFCYSPRDLSRLDVTASFLGRAAAPLCFEMFV